MNAKPWPRPSKDNGPTPGLRSIPTVITHDTVVAPAPGVRFSIRSLDNWRAFIHQVTPVLVSVFVTVGIVTDTQAALWVPLAFAILDPLLSVGNAQDKVRRIIYGLAGLMQVGGITTALVTGLGSGGNGVIAAGVGAGVTVLSTFLARFFTPTTTLLPAA